MTDRTGNRGSVSPAIPWWDVPALLLAILQMTAALAARGGGDSSAAATTEPQATDTRDATAEPQITNTRIVSQATAAPATERAEPEPTQQGILGRARDEGGEMVKVKFTSISIGGGHTCTVKTGGSVACWGRDIWAGPRRQLGSSPPSAPGVNTPAG